MKPNHVKKLPLPSSVTASQYHLLMLNQSTNLQLLQIRRLNQLMHLQKQSAPLGVKLLK
jgi:hypothetical protein